MIRYAGAAAIIAFTAAACFSLDGFSGGAPVSPEGGTPDATSTQPLPEASADVVAQEPVDAGPDAADAGPILDCTGAYICDDFERTDPIGPVWTDGQYETPSSSYSITTDDAFTGQSSLRIAIGTGSNQEAEIQRNLPASIGQIDFTYHVMRHTDADGINLMNLLWIVDNTGTYSKLYLQIGMNQLIFVEQSYASNVEQSYEQTAGAPMPVDTWVPIVIHFDFTAKTYTASANGVVLANRKALVANYPAVTPSVQCGSDYSGSGKAIVVDIDDVVVKVTPP